MIQEVPQSQSEPPTEFPPEEAAALVHPQWAQSVELLLANAQPAAVAAAAVTVTDLGEDREAATSIVALPETPGPECLLPPTTRSAAEATRR